MALHAFDSPEFQTLTQYLGYTTHDNAGISTRFSPRTIHISRWELFTPSVLCPRMFVLLKLLRAVDIKLVDQLYILQFACSEKILFFISKDSDSNPCSLEGFITTMTHRLAQTAAREAALYAALLVDTSTQGRSNRFEPVQVRFRFSRGSEPDRGNTSPRIYVGSPHNLQRSRGMQYTCAVGCAESASEKNNGHLLRSSVRPVKQDMEYRRFDASDQEIPSTPGWGKDAPPRWPFSLVARGWLRGKTSYAAGAAVSPKSGRTNCHNSNLKKKCGSNSNSIRVEIGYDWQHKMLRRPGWEAVASGYKVDSRWEYITIILRDPKQESRAVAVAARRGLRRKESRLGRKIRGMAPCPIDGTVPAVPPGAAHMKWDVRRNRSPGASEWNDTKASRWNDTEARE
ncbi:hypothetical protein B0H10DRAFT_1951989 [Mycena sp. CBHHK59/15]|nr:hypothetical protein B0H10DRAFT_1951989 [Mycena sp. CBHHK59/15]